MYIASQAPSAETINDFWLMIWQEKCSVVLMVRHPHSCVPEEVLGHTRISFLMKNDEILAGN